MNPHDMEVLVVDDDRDMLRIVRAYLQPEGFRLRLHTDPAQALDDLQANPPDVLITDWNMPGMTGLELCRRVRSLDQPKYIYVLIATGKSGSEAAVEGLGAGADDFLVKPLDRAELLARLRAGLRVVGLERRLRQLAHTDALTGVATRRWFLERIQQEFDHMRRRGGRLACAMLDVDLFKRVNDTYGHAAGDRVLGLVAGVLGASCRSHDLVGRFGGEEFCIALPDANEAQAAAWAERVVSGIRQLRFPIDGGSFAVTASIGVAERSGDADTPEALIDRADQALLVAKQRGRDRVIAISSLDDFDEGSDAAGKLNDDLMSRAVARDVMAAPIACLHKDDTIGRAVEFFCRFRIHSAPVVDAEGRLAGFLSDKDLLASMLANSAWSQQVRELMKTNVVAYPDNTPLRTIYDFLCRVAIRRVVIVRDGKPVGAIARDHLLRWRHHAVQACGLYAASAGEGAEDREWSWKQMDDAAEELVEHAARLRRLLAERPADAAPIVVSETSQLQELLVDLLSYSAPADRNELGRLAW